ncbi:MAG: STAS/SEC14 domain-containing protein [Polyangiaceae bacterium]|nr:STAS/SEC14 domain-containing protein [Polyangiaceae bacterium]
MKQASFSWRILGDVAVSFASEGQIRDADWNPFVKELSDKPVRKYVSATLSNLEVNSVQRKAIIDVLRAKNISVAVVTDDKLVIGMVTAASWFGANVKAFSWANLDAALRHLSIADSMLQQITQTISTLRTKTR